MMNEKERNQIAKFIAQRFRDDPKGYCKAVLDFQPDPWQSKVLESIVSNRRVAVRSGHGVGKTRLAAAVIHWFIATRERPQIVVTANTFIQLREKTWRELSKVNSNAVNADCFEYTATRFALKESEIWFASAVPHSEHKPEAFAGTHEENVLMVFDESSAIPEEIWETAMGAMTTKGSRWLSLGNPTRNTGKFHDCFGVNKWEKGDSEDSGKWHTFTVSCLDSPRVDPAYISEIAREYGEESDPYRVRVLGLPPIQEEQQFISHDLFEGALHRKVRVSEIAPRIMGVDVARSGIDRSVLVERKGGAMKMLYAIRGEDTMKITGRVMTEIAQARVEGEPYDYICVDVIGVGGGVVDRLREQNVKVVEVNVSEKPRIDGCKNLRAELWKSYKDWLKKGQVTEEFRDDSCGIHYSYDSNGSLVIERKEDMKKRGLASPDVADAACMTFFPLNPIKQTESKRKRKKKTKIYRGQ